MKQRIASVDGWRAIAALGVLYTHTWALLNFPSMNIGGINMMQFLNLWGNGVQLFFVISGFCFYLVLYRRPVYDLSTSLGFWKKRWLRIAPAFYIACTVYALSRYSELGHNFAWSLFFNYAFVQNMVPNAEIAAHFWSLAVEWHFYLLLPLIFLLIRKTGVIGVVIALLGVQIILSLLHYKGLIMHGHKWHYTIFCNIGHFAWGILLAWLFTERLCVGFFSKPWSALIGFAIAYMGKICFFSSLVSRMGSLGFVFQTIGPLVVSLGFACMIYSSLESKVLSAIIGHKYITALGRISYSFYLWHFLILGTVWQLCGKFIPQTATGVFILILLVLCLLIPLSFISYRFLESFYFRGQSKEKPANILDNATAR